MSDASWIDRREEFQKRVSEISPVIRLTTKSHWIWRAVARLMWLASFGQFSRVRFLERFATTIGPIQAYPREWTDLEPRLLVHESRHTLQFLFAGYFVPIVGWFGRPLRVWCGLIPMAFVYGLFPLPMFLAWGRFRLELDAEAYAWRVGMRQGWLDADDVRRRASSFADTVSSWAYLRAWPSGWTRKAFAKRAEREIEMAAKHESSPE